MITHVRTYLRALKFDFSAQIALFVVILLLIHPILEGFPLKIISWDTYGYYLYLPQMFIEGDIAIQDLQPILETQQIYQPSPTFYQAHLLDNGNHVIQYPAGMAIAFLPFFLLGHLFASLFGYPLDGFSEPYAWAMILGSITYMIIGIFLLRKLLLHFFSPKISGITLLLVLLGTNYLAIHLMSHGMPHVYLFPLYADLILLTIKWHQNFSKKTAIFIGLIIGWMILIRPTEGLAILIPILWGIHDKSSLKQKLANLKKHYSGLLLAVIAGFIVISIQLIYWKFVTGSFVFNSYANPGEGFDFDSPHLLDFLFSYRKGWFVYTPLMLLPFIAIFIKGKEKKWWLSFIAFSLVTIYVSASWSNWWYAASFSQRTMMQSYPLFALPLGLIIQKLSIVKWQQWTFGSIITLAFLLNVFQTWQFKNGIISEYRMTQDYYWAVFGKTSAPPGAADLLLIDRLNPEFEEEKYEVFANFTLAQEMDSTEARIHLVGENEWGNNIRVPYAATSNKDHAWYQVEFDAFVPQGSDPSKILIVFNFMHGEGVYGPWNIPITECGYNEPGTWQHVEAIYLSPDIRKEEDLFVTYVWSRKEEIVYKNFEVTSYREK